MSDLTRRKSVRARPIGRIPSGPVSILRITYRDNRRSWGVSLPGMLALFGSDRAEANRYARAMLAHFNGGR